MSLGRTTATVNIKQEEGEKRGFLLLELGNARE
jgi:hypothetical protein